jgi:hypothetical protein
MSGVPSISISLYCSVNNAFIHFFVTFFTGIDSLTLNCLDFRRKDESKDSDFKDAVTICLPLLDAAIRYIEKGVFPTNCSLK